MKSFQILMIKKGDPSGRPYPFLFFFFFKLGDLLLTVKGKVGTN